MSRSLLYHVKDKKIGNTDLNKLYARFVKANIFSGSRVQFFKINKGLDRYVSVIDIHKFEVNSEIAKQHAPELALFFLDIIRAMQKIQYSQKVKISEKNMLRLIQYLRLQIEHFDSGQTIEMIVAAEEIKRKLIEVLPNNKEDKLYEKLAELLGNLILKHPHLRNFKTIAEFSDPRQPIDRIILLTNSDLADVELLSDLEIFIKNHPDENIIVTSNNHDVENVNFHNQTFNKKFILHLMGQGGGVTKDEKFDANRIIQNSDEHLSKLVNKCKNISEVRIATSSGQKSSKKWRS